MEQGTVTTQRRRQHKTRCPIPFVLPQTKANSERYVRLLRQAGHEYPKAFGFKHGFTPQDAQDARKRFMAYGVVTLVCTDDKDRLVGGVCYRRVDDTNRLQMAYLCRLKRASGQAVGQLLFRRVLLVAQQNGGNAVSFDVMQQNEHALGMYHASNVETFETGRSSAFLNEPFLARIEGEEVIAKGIKHLTGQITEKNI